MDRENKLKYYRMKQKLSQSDVADKLNISRQSISNWENSKTSPDLDSLKLLSQLYRVSIDELLDNTPIYENSVESLPKVNLEYILIIIASVLFLLTLFTNSPYGIVLSVILLLYNRARVKSKLIVILCLVTIILNVLHFAVFLLL